MWKNLLLLLTSLMVAIILGEVVLRIAVPERQIHVPNLVNNRLTYEPDQKQRSKYLEWDYEIRINSDGFRNDRTIAQLPASSILVLGDSFTEGYGVALEDSFPARLEALLKQDGRDNAVYNAGHTDTNPTYYGLLYDNKFREVTAIERVIVGFYIGNDFLRSPGPYDAYLQVGNEFGGGFVYRLKTFLATNSMTYATGNYILKNNRSIHTFCQSLGLCADMWRPEELYTQDFVDKAVPLTTAYLRRFANRVSASDKKLLVVLIPPREQVDDKQWARAIEQLGPAADSFRFAAAKQLGEALEREGIKTLDLTKPVLRHYRSGAAPLYFTHDGHWNPAGHDLAAREIFKIVKGQLGK